MSDNKGPIVAAACAVATLLSRGALECDVVFLIEGEEEAGSGGFEESVKAYKVSWAPFLVGDLSTDDPLFRRTK